MIIHIYEYVYEAPYVLYQRSKVYSFQTKLIVRVMILNSEFNDIFSVVSKINIFIPSIMCIGRSYSSVYVATPNRNHNLFFFHFTRNVLVHARRLYFLQSY